MINQRRTFGGLSCILIATGLFTGCESSPDAGTTIMEGVNLGAMSAPDESPISEALRRADYAIQEIVEIPDGQRSFDNTIGAIDDLFARLGQDTDLVAFLAYVSPDASVRETGERAEVDVGNWLVDFSKREDLYNAVMAYAASKPELEGEQQRLLKHLLRDYRRAGMDLTQAQRDELTTIEKEIIRLSLDFERFIREDATRIPLTRDELEGMSDEYLATLPRSGELYLMGMSYPEFLPVMDQC
ncbi:MAG: hypothetical protein O7G85_16290, partial [Planctomycetota bacterium]|nr:hypothetical protein [Planctomycetota bacterium]